MTRSRERLDMCVVVNMLVWKLRTSSMTRFGSLSRSLLFLKERRFHFSTPTNRRAHQISAAAPFNFKGKVVSFQLDETQAQLPAQSDGPSQFLAGQNFPKPPLWGVGWWHNGYVFLLSCLGALNARLMCEGRIWMVVCLQPCATRG